MENYRLGSRVFISGCPAAAAKKVPVARRSPGRGVVTEEEI